MGLRIFEIEFDNPTKTFLAGQNLVGKVVVEVDQIEMKVQGEDALLVARRKFLRDCNTSFHRIFNIHVSELVLRLWGKAEVSWVDPKKHKQPKTSRPKTSATPEIRISHSRDHATSDKMYSKEESYCDRRHTILEKSKF